MVAGGTPIAYGRRRTSRALHRWTTDTPEHHLGAFSGRHERGSGVDAFHRVFRGPVMTVWFVILVPLVIMFFALFMERVEARLHRIEP